MNFNSLVTLISEDKDNCPFIDLSESEFHHASNRLFNWPKPEANPQFQFLTYGPGFYIAPMTSNNKNWGKFKYRITLSPNANIVNGDCRIKIDDLPTVFPNARGLFKTAIEKTISKGYWVNGLRIRDFLYEMTKNKIPCYLSGINGIADEILEICLFKTDKSIISSFEKISQ